MRVPLLNAVRVRAGSVDAELDEIWIELAGLRIANAEWLQVPAVGHLTELPTSLRSVSHRGAVAGPGVDDHRIDGYQSSSIHSLGKRGRARACGGGGVRSGLCKVGVGGVGGGDVLDMFCSETFASTRFISSWLALSSAMALELSLAICCWFALSCSMVRSKFARSRAIACSNCA